MAAAHVAAAAEGRTRYAERSPISLLDRFPELRGGGCPKRAFTYQYKPGNGTLGEVVLVGGAGTALTAQ